MAPAVDCIILIANWPSERQSHWETLLRARAIECQAFVIGVNRRGRGGDLDYAGGSVAFDPWGEQLASAGDPKIVEVDEKVVTSARRKFPLIRDERRGPM